FKFPSAKSKQQPLIHGYSHLAPISLLIIQKSQSLLGLSCYFHSFVFEELKFLSRLFPMNSKESFQQK
ncbi:MAG: hypothetical protein L6R36_008088, partial [Xanthoria steineri]